MVKVKICGITNLKDAEAAVRYGADALGFIFAPSPRRVSVRTVRSISERIGPYVTKVGVFVNAPLKKMLRVTRTCRLDAVQLHGNESPAICVRLRPYKVIKAFSMDDRFSPADTNRYPAEAFIFETASAKRGGTGRTWNWKKIVRSRFRKPVIVTGGLNSRNVRHAIRLLKPYAVDVSSGVERAPGKKDHALMKRFIHNAKGK